MEKVNDNWRVVSSSASLSPKEQNERSQRVDNNNNNPSFTPVPSSSLSGEQQNSVQLWQCRPDFWKDPPELEGFYPVYTGEDDDHHPPQEKGYYRLKAVLRSTNSTTLRTDMKAAPHLLP